MDTPPEWHVEPPPTPLPIGGGREDDLQQALLKKWREGAGLKSEASLLLGPLECQSHLPMSRDIDWDEVEEEWMLFGEEFESYGRPDFIFAHHHVAAKPEKHDDAVDQLAGEVAEISLGPSKNAAAEKKVVAEKNMTAEKNSDTETEPETVPDVKPIRTPEVVGASLAAFTIIETKICHRADDMIQYCVSPHTHLEPNEEVVRSLRAYDIVRSYSAAGIIKRANQQAMRYAKCLRRILATHGMRDIRVFYQTMVAVYSTANKRVDRIAVGSLEEVTI